jgi:cytochrome c biogenesis protein CcmG/thiol:disulfide interchange protein DsbE
MSRRVWIYGGLGLAATGLLWAGASYVERASERLTADAGLAPLRFDRNGPTVPTLELTDLDGRPLSTADWDGKVTIVNFWATWCPPCRAEIPEFVALQAKYPDELRIVGVSLDEGPPELVRRFAVDYGVNYPMVMITAELQRTFPGVFALPTSFVLDRDRRVVQRHVGLVSISVYERALRALAGLDPHAVIEEVDQGGSPGLGSSALATDIPGIDLSGLSSDARRTALERLNSEQCTCGCGFTLAGCRINDPNCQISLPLAQKLVQELAATPGS